MRKFTLENIKKNRKITLSWRGGGVVTQFFRIHAEFRGVKNTTVNHSEIVITSYETTFDFELFLFSLFAITHKRHIICVFVPLLVLRSLTILPGA